MGSFVNKCSYNCNSLSLIIEINCSFKIAIGSFELIPPLTLSFMLSFQSIKNIVVLRHYYKFVIDEGDCYVHVIMVVIDVSILLLTYIAINFKI